MSELSLTRFRVCTKCGCTKVRTLEFFSRHKTSGEGLRNYCKVCARLSLNAWRSDNREHSREYQKRYFAAYYKANRGHLREINERWRQANLERWKASVSESQKVRRERFPEQRKSQRRLTSSRRRARERAAEGQYTFEEIEQMYVDQGGMCAYCESKLNGDYEIDHMTPLSRGGRNDWTNLAISCPHCNARKYTKSAEEFMNR